MFNGTDAKSQNSSLIGRQKEMNLAGYGDQANQMLKLFNSFKSLDPDWA